MLSETIYLVLTLASGAVASWAVAEQVVLHTTSRSLFVSSFTPSLWHGLLAITVFLHSRQKHHVLRQTRLRGCAPAAVYAHKDPFLGLDYVSALTKRSKTYQILECWSSLFEQYGSTFWVQAFGSWTLMTTEPENIKAILATQFDSWPIAGQRLNFALFVLGPHAIFSTNGKAWQHARAVIRPSFVRSQIADLEIMGRHMDNLLSKLPRDGTKFEFQQLIYNFTMDTSTDFMQASPPCSPCKVCWEN
jgi:hypothetical protein